MLWVLGTTRVVGFEEDIGDTCFRGTRCPGGGTGWARNYIISKQKKMDLKLVIYNSLLLEITSSR